MTTDQNNQAARLLVIEDDASIPLLLGHWLQKHSSARLTIDHMLTPEGAAERCKGAACILLDLNIPPRWRKEDTLAMIPELRKCAPVVVLTGHNTGSDEDDAKFASDVVSEYGAEALIFKNSLFTEGGIAWLFTAVSAAMARRLYDNKQTQANEPKPPLPCPA